MRHKTCLFSRNLNGFFLRSTGRLYKLPVISMIKSKSCPSGFATPIPPFANAWCPQWHVRLGRELWLSCDYAFFAFAAGSFFHSAAVFVIDAGFFRRYACSKADRIKSKSAGVSPVNKTTFLGFSLSSSYVSVHLS
jgi:hypothetical protein